MQRSEMIPEVQTALAVLDRVTTDNIHLITNANWSQRVNFESAWFRHTPQAARYGLLPAYWNNELTVADEV